MTTYRCHNARCGYAAKHGPCVIMAPYPPIVGCVVEYPRYAAKWGGDVEIQTREPEVDTPDVEQLEMNLT